MDACNKFAVCEAAYILISIYLLDAIYDIEKWKYISYIKKIHIRSCHRSPFAHINVIKILCLVDYIRDLGHEIRVLFLYYCYW